MALKRRPVHPEELSKEFEPEALPSFSESELEKFGEALDKYRVPREVKRIDGQGTETVHIVDMNEAMIAFGAMKKTYHLGVPHYAVLLKPTDTDKYGNITQYQKPTMLDYFMNKYDQWIEMIGRRDFIEKKKIQGLQELADTMTVGEFEEAV